MWYCFLWFSWKFVFVVGFFGMCSVVWECYRVEWVVLIVQVQVRGGCGVFVVELWRLEYLVGGRDDRVEFEEFEGEVFQGFDSSQVCWGEGYGGDFFVGMRVFVLVCDFGVWWCCCF